MLFQKQLTHIYNLYKTKAVGQDLDSCQ